MKKEKTKEKKEKQKYKTEYKTEMPLQIPTAKTAPKSLKEMEKQIPEKVKKEIEQIKEQLKEFKKTIIKKFPFINAIGILPISASQIIEEEEEVEKEKEEKLIHLIIFVPEEKAKQIPKLKLEAIKLVQGLKPKVWLHIKSTKELWELCFDGKYKLVDAIAMSFPLHDKGILGAIRVATIHKSLILRKFERYVVSYIIAGSVVREQATKTSDVDIYVVIDDTDVKRMSRLELKEKLRAIVYSYAIEANEIAGVKNKLSPQIYILTEFWEAVKDAHPVIFTFIRDGVPLYDRGAFMPWKLLLRMGKIKPSPEAIDMFMSLGERVARNVKRKLNEIATEDIYWGIITPSQAVIMLYGIAPPTPKETVTLMREIFVEKEKLLEPKYVEILNKIVSLYKKYEHEEIKTISGKEIDTLVEQSSDYIKRLKELMQQIEKKSSEQEITQIYGNVFSLLKNIFSSVSETAIVNLFEKELVKKAKLSKRSLSQLKEIIALKKKKKKITKRDIATARHIDHELTTSLLEYTQRKELVELEKRKIEIIYKTKEAGKEVTKKGELFLFKDVAFITPDINLSIVKKIKDSEIIESNKEELRKLVKKKGKIEKKITPELLSALKKLFGKFELIFK